MYLPFYIDVLTGQKKVPCYRQKVILYPHNPKIKKYNKYDDH